VKPRALDPPLPPSPAPLDADEFDALEGMARSLTASGWYRVVRKFEPRDRYAAEDGSDKRLALYVDVETTGLDVARDQAIEVGAVLFEYGVGDGRIFAIRELYSAFEDPGRHIPDAVTRMTGITDQMVAGQRIDERALESLVQQAALVIAHKASFDRGFLERRLPVFATKPWACSRDDVPWREHGCASSSLDYLLYRHCAKFYNAHRALDDCLAGVHALATPLVNGSLPFALLLDSARRPLVRIWAVGSAFEVKDALRARGYRWNGGEDGRPKSWYLETAAQNRNSETAWLREHAYPGRREDIRVETVSALERFAKPR
jgi:DNA polymerase-3 subunit epsilon